MSAPVQPSTMELKQWLKGHSVEQFVERHKLNSSQKLQELPRNERHAILVEMAFAFLQTECKQAAFEMTNNKKTGSIEMHSRILVMCKLVAPAEAMAQQLLQRWSVAALSLSTLRPPPLRGVFPLYISSDRSVYFSSEKTFLKRPFISSKCVEKSHLVEVDSDALFNPTCAVYSALTRFMCGWVTFTSRHLVAAPASMFSNAERLQLRWAAGIVDRVFWGYRCKARAAVCARIMGTPHSNFFDAAYRGDLALIEDLFCYCYDVDKSASTATSWGTWPSTCLVPYEHIIGKDGDLFVSDTHHGVKSVVIPTPLTAAIAGSSQAGTVASSHADVISLLIQAKVDVNFDGGVWCNTFAISDFKHAELACSSAAVVAALLAPNGRAPKVLQNALCKAVELGFIDSVKELLNHKADPNYSQYPNHEESCLSLALNSKRVELDIVAALIEAKADVDFCRFDEKNFKRRMKPVMKASEIGRADVLSALIDGGAGIDSSLLSLAQIHNHENAVIFLEQALHAQAMASAIGAAKAGNSSAIEALAMAGGDLNIVDNHGWSAAHWAAAAGHAKCIEALAKARANIDVLARDGTAPLHWAASRGHVSCIQALSMSGCNVNVLDRYGKTPLHHAIEVVVGVKNHRFDRHKNQRALFYSLIKYTGNEPIPITHFSLSLHPSIELLPVCVSALLEACADVNIRDSDEATALSRLSFFCDPSLSPKSENLEAQASLYKISKATSRSLIFDVLKNVVSHGADVYVCDGSGDSPLHLSVLSFVGDSKFWDFPEVEVERTLFLLEAGARVETRNRDGKSCLDLMLQLLSYAHPNKNAASPNNNELRQKYHQNKIIRAAAYREILVKAGAMNLVPPIFPIFHILLETELSNDRVAAAHVAQLTFSQHGASCVNAVQFGKTPLMIAIKRGLEHCVEALLTAGANPNVLWTSKYRSPLALATYLGLDRIVALLLKFGADPNVQYDRRAVGGVEYAIQLTADKPAIRSILLAAGARFVPPPPPPDSNQACRIL